MVQSLTRGRIRTPRRGLNGAEAALDFESTWPTLRSAFQEIHDDNASTLSYEALYRFVYRLVINKQGDKLYDAVKSFEHDWLCQRTKPDILNSLTASLADFATNSDVSLLETNVTGSRRMEGEAFLRGMQTKWEKHLATMKMLSAVLMYLDKAYCADQRKPNILLAAMNQFRDIVLFAPSSPTEKAPDVVTLMNTVILDQIRMERADELINQDYIRHCIWMLDGLTVGQSDTSEQKLYDVSFETAFLASSRKFFEEEAKRLLSESDASQYCIKVTKRLEREQKRCGSMLMDSTQPKILAVVEDELIRKKIADVIKLDTGVQHMIDNDALSDLGRVFQLEQRVDTKTPEFTQALQRRVEIMGAEVNKAAEAAAIAPPQADATSAPKEAEASASKAPETAGVPRQLGQQTLAAIKWVGEVLELKDKFDRILEQACKKDNGVQAAITTSFRNFVNSLDFANAAEYVSLFIDDNMKRGIKDKTDAEIDEVLNKAILLLRYINDKDMFERYYKKHLAKRLLMSKSLNVDTEKNMVSLIKIDCGNNFTQKLEAMFKDMVLSKDLSAEYREYVRSQGGRQTVDLDVHILTSLTWPDLGRGLQAGERTQPAQSKLPSEIETLQRSFENHYLKKHNGRKLDWHLNLGSADMYARFKRKYDINVPTYGMIVLCLFNEHDSLSYEQIKAETNLGDHDLTRTLTSLSIAPKTRLLKKEPMSRTVQATDVFSVNENFTSKFIKIKIGLAAAGNRVETDKERKTTEEKVLETRRYAIDAAIVRIMKQRKELQHSHLILETIEQLKQHFKPDVSLIKSRVENLIEREYLERVADVEPAKYRYLA